ncbi:MAG: FIG00953527: hypothetical protein, partial [uncultured Ramlibacter sp.]
EEAHPAGRPRRRCPAVRLRGQAHGHVQAVRPGHVARHRPGSGGQPRGHGNRGRRRHHLRMPGQGQRGGRIRVGVRRPRRPLDGPRRQASRQVLRPARHLGEHGRLQADGHASRRGPGRGGQHPAATRQGQPGHGQRRHERHHLHPARGHPGRCRAGHALRPDQPGQPAGGEVPGRLHLLQGDV